MTDAPRDDHFVKIADIAIAFSLLSRIPVRLSPELAAARSAKAVWAYPIVGGILAAIAGLIGYAQSLAGVSSGPVCAIVLVVLALLSGGLHEDGLADSADGLFGGRNKDHALEIMRDSRVGAFGVTALILILIIRWSAMRDLLDLDVLLASLVTAHMVSRGIMACGMALVQAARKDGLSALTGAPTLLSAGIGLSLATGVGAICIGPAIIGLVLAGIASAGALLWLAHRKIGGQTGDILGATQQVSECAILVLATALLA